MPFFDSEERLVGGWFETAAEPYRAAPLDSLWGKVTPRYMEDPQVPERTRRVMPEVKLIALLRNRRERRPHARGVQGPRERRP